MLTDSEIPTNVRQTVADRLIELGCTKVSYDHPPTSGTINSVSAIEHFAICAGP